MYPTFRTAVLDPSHFNKDLWNENNLIYIQTETSNRLLEKNIKTIVPLEQIRNVVDSVAEANPHIDTKGATEMVIRYIVNYIFNEETVNKTPAYDSSVLNYDGTFGIQRFSQGQLGIKKKGLNRTGRMF